MTYHHNQRTQAKDTLSELQEILSERQREYFKLTHSSGLPNRIWEFGAYQTQHTVSPRLAPSQNRLDLTKGKIPSPIGDRIKEWYQETFIPSKTTERLADLRMESAPSFGANPTEFVWTHSTTDAMMAIFRNFDWQSGDFCLTTNMEHSGGLGSLHSVINQHAIQPLNYGSLTTIDPITGLFDADGIPVLAHDGNVLSLPTGIAETDDSPCGYPIYAERNQYTSYDDLFFKQHLEPTLEKMVSQTSGPLKLVFFSSPSFITGIRLPEKQLARWSWNHHAYSLVDGAQVSGMAEINLHEMGIDFFATSGHKWQAGPSQTGFAYFRRGTEATPANRRLILSDNRVVEYQNLPYANPTPLPRFWPPHGASFKEPSDSEMDPITSLLGTPDPEYPFIRGLYECIKLWDSLGRGIIEDYIVTLSQYLRWRLSEISPITALYAEFRKNRGDTWSDVWDMTKDKFLFPTHARTGLTAWSPFKSTLTQTVDANNALSAEEAQKQALKTQQLLSRLASRFGIHTRSTRCPHQIRTPKGGFSANRFPELGPVTASTPIRLATYLYHQAEDIDRLIEAFTHSDIMELYED